MKTKQRYRTKTKAYYNSRFGAAFEDQLNQEEALRWAMIEKQLKGILAAHTIENPRILDFGCANGRFSYLLSKYGEVTGIDYADAAIDLARNKFPAIEFHAADATAPEVVDLVGKRFDILISTEVIEHILESESYLKNIEKLLKPGGHLIMTTPNKKWFDQFFEFGNKKSDQPYELWHTLAGLKANLINLNFSILRAGTFRSNWIFTFKTFGLLRLISNRFFHKILYWTGCKKLFLKLADWAGLGIYLIIVARK